MSDDLDAVRGILTGCAIGAALWLLLIVGLPLAWFAFECGYEKGIAARRPVAEDATVATYVGDAR